MRISVRRIIDSHYFLWTLLLLPSLPMIAALLASSIPPDGKPVTEALLHPTGELAARLMIVAMALTPLRILFPYSRFLAWTIKRRRYLGVAAFSYALAHAALYVVDMGTLRAMLDELGAPGIWTGWLAFFILLPLAMTSNSASVRALGRSWKVLQRFIYPAAIATLIHWVYVHNNSAAALLHFLPLVALEGYRVWHTCTRFRSHRVQTA